MAQVQFINVPGVGRVKLGDYLHKRLRSAIRPATNQSTELLFFRNSIGDAIAGDSSTNLTKYDTNLQQRDGLPPGWAAMVYYFSVWFPQTMTLANMQDVQAKTLFELIIGSTDKVLDDGQMIHYATGGGISGVTTQNATEQWSNGVPAAGARNAYLVPHFIPSDPRVPFQVRTSFPAAALAQGSTRSTWYSALEGILRQPVA